MKILNLLKPAVVLILLLSGFSCQTGKVGKLQVPAVNLDTIYQDYIYPPSGSGKYTILVSSEDHIQDALYYKRLSENEVETHNYTQVQGKFLINNDYIISFKASVFRIMNHLGYFNQGSQLLEKLKVTYKYITNTPYHINYEQTQVSKNFGVKVNIVDIKRSYKLTDTGVSVLEVKDETSITFKGSKGGSDNLTSIIVSRYKRGSGLIWKGFYDTQMNLFMEETLVKNQDSLDTWQ